MRCNIARNISFCAGMALVLAGCSAGPLADRVPTELGGLPSGAPQRTPTPPPYPAVHDLPPSRPTAALSDEDQLKLEKELAAARKQQGRLQDPTIKGRGEKATTAMEKAKDTVNAATKKKPSAPNSQ